MTLNLISNVKHVTFFTVSFQNLILLIYIILIGQAKDRYNSFQNITVLSLSIFQFQKLAVNPRSRSNIHFQSSPFKEVAVIPFLLRAPN